MPAKTPTLHIAFAVFLVLGIACTGEHTGKQTKHQDLREIIAASDTTIIVYLKDSGCPNCDAYIYNVVEQLDEHPTYFITAGAIRKKVMKALVNDWFNPIQVPDDRILSAQDFEWLLSTVNQNHLERSNLLVFDSTYKLLYAHLDDMNRPKNIHQLLHLFQPHGD